MLQMGFFRASASYSSAHSAVSFRQLLQAPRLSSFPKAATEGTGVACASRTSLGVRETTMTGTFIKAVMIAGVTGAMAAVSPAGAGETVAVGHLDCGIKGGVSFIFGSTRELRCVFRPRL